MLQPISMAGKSVARRASQSTELPGELSSEFRFALCHLIPPFCRVVKSGAGT